jgi:hypothetical protein
MRYRCPLRVESSRRCLAHLIAVYSPPAHVSEICLVWRGPYPVADDGLDIWDEQGETKI